MITIPAMPNSFRTLPPLNLSMTICQLRMLAFTLDRIKLRNEWTHGLCIAVEEQLNNYNSSDKFGNAVSIAINSKDGKDCNIYLYHYLGQDVGIKDLVVIRKA